MRLSQRLKIRFRNLKIRTWQRNDKETKIIGLKLKEKNLTSKENHASILKGKQICVKLVKNACKFYCATNIDKVAEEKIFHDFYNLNTDGKHSFINQTSVVFSIASNPTSQKIKKLSSYFFINGMNSVWICKKFYFATLAASQKMVYNVHQRRYLISGTTKSDGQSKHRK